MFAEQERVVRVGLWLVVVAAITGLVVLLLQGRVAAAELEVSAAELQSAAESLLDVAPLTPEERLLAAERVLDADLASKRRRLLGSSLELGWSIWAQTSPRRAVKGTWNVVRAVWNWRARSSAEDRALDLLEGGIASDAAIAARYAELREREVAARASELLASAELAREQGHLALARVRVRHSLDLVAGSDRATALLEELTRSRSTDSWASAPGVAAWEPALATALLAGDYERVLESAPSGAGGWLARAAASTLSGDHARARQSLSALGEREDALGRTAREWSQRPELAAESRFTASLRDYRVRRTLGWIGGEKLASDGLEPTARGYRAWRDSLTPLNLAISLPARVLRGWRPADNALEVAAREYLDHDPHGSQVGAASFVLSEAAARAGAGASPDAADRRFVLPAARTPFTTLAAGPLLVTRAALDSEFIASGALREVLGDADAVLLRPEYDAVPLPTLDEATALTLIAEVARGIERSDLRALDHGRAASLERLHRLDAAVRAGAILVALPIAPSDSTLRESIGRVGIDGGSEVAGGLHLERGDDDLRLERALDAAGLGCPERAVCVDRQAWISASVYGSLGTDSDAGVGASATFQRARLAVELSIAGPRASLELPVADWLGIERWVPVAARIAIGTDGIYVGPVFAGR